MSGDLIYPQVSRRSLLGGGIALAGSIACESLVVPKVAFSYPVGEVVQHGLIIEAAYADEVMTALEACKYQAEQTREQYQDWIRGSGLSPAEKAIEWAKAMDEFIQNIKNCENNYGKSVVLRAAGAAIGVVVLVVVLIAGIIFVLSGSGAAPVLGGAACAAA